MNDKLINIKTAANILNVSEATVRNWIKTGLLNSKLRESNVINVKNSIANGDIKRLNKRANKSKSTKSFIPSEYLDDTNVLESVSDIIKYSRKHFNNNAEIIFNLVIAFIDEIDYINNELVFKRLAFKLVFDEFNEKQKFKPNPGFLNHISNKIRVLKGSKITDVLGLLYQSLLSEGDKSQKGSYYTPTKIINSLINDLSNDINTFLDPCCGTGAFILSAIKLKKLKPQNVYGADLDKNAVFLTKINILSTVKDYNKVPKIYHVEALNKFATGHNLCTTNFLINQIDAIASNPPWGADKNNNASSKYQKILGSKEIYSMFILKAINLLKDTGEFHFLLPESILNIKTHQNIRNFLCSKTKIISIKEYGRAFTGVYTPVISIHAQVSENSGNNKVKIQAIDKTHFVKQNRFLKNNYNVFDIKIDAKNKVLIDKIYSVPYYTLTNNAKWALGVVTGNNLQHIQSTNNKGLEPIYRGSDVKHYYLKTPTSFINSNNRNKFQQITKDEIYRTNEKLIYKFISNKLVFAYDTQKLLSLNSANILIPNITDYDIKVVLAFLNSTVFQYLHQIMFSTQKILKSNLEQLPFPIIDSSVQKRIINYVNKAIDGDVTTIQFIEDIIFEIFQLNESEREFIENYIQ
ncbi:MAG: TaqI-like C-terminal specificity domain-containing protein [Bacteroidales bacterium]|nr:TaqI-like C-terminal specificity domain-containing protein [Bacteroidales bacterium]